MAPHASTRHSKMRGMAARRHGAGTRRGVRRAGAGIARGGARARTPHGTRTLYARAQSRAAQWRRMRAASALFTCKEASQKEQQPHAQCAACERPASSGRQRSRALFSYLMAAQYRRDILLLL